MRIVVADDVMLTREGIIRLLTGAGVDVVGEAGDAASLLRAAAAICAITAALHKPGTGAQAPLAVRPG